MTAPATARGTDRIGCALATAAAAASDVVCPTLGLPARLAVPMIDHPTGARPIRRVRGILESAIVDRNGRLFYTNQTSDGLYGAVFRMDTPKATPRTLVDRIPAPGGLAFDDEGMLLVGYGDSPHGGLIGNLVGLAGLLRVNPDSGARETWITGLGMANGIARDHDGSIYASNDLGTHIERVDPHGTIDRHWARVPSANGLAIDPAKRCLYAAQTFVPAAIARVDLDHPHDVMIHAQPPPLARAAALDGLAIDHTGRLYVAANGAGQIWRIDTNGEIRALARGLRCPSAVALGRGTDGFSQGHLYAVTFHGDIIELPNVIGP